jgi:hypothetical protein
LLRCKREEARMKISHGLQQLDEKFALTEICRNNMLCSKRKKVGLRYATFELIIRLPNTEV